VVVHPPSVVIHGAPIPSVEETNTPSRGSGARDAPVAEVLLNQLIADIAPGAFLSPQTLKLDSQQSRVSRCLSTTEFGDGRLLNFSDSEPDTIFLFQANLAPQHFCPI